MLNQTAIYAVRAMGFLAQKERSEPVLSSIIASKMDIPSNFLSKILNRLAQAGLVRTTRGRGGGIRLARPGSEIHLIEVVEQFMKIDDFKKCFLGLKQCDGGCGLHERWRVISSQFEQMLNEMTMDQISHQSGSLVL